jgi:hypothetical protein
MYGRPLTSEDAPAGVGGLGWLMENIIDNNDLLTRHYRLGKITIIKLTSINETFPVRAM